MADHIFMLAGEASGDKLGGLILEEMAVRGYTPLVTGVGGDDMQDMGLEPVFPMHELSIIGIYAAITNYWRLKRRIAQLVGHIRRTKPRMVLTIDSKAFSLQLGKELKRVMAKEGWHVPIIHLVAPTVWAWAGWRAKKVGNCVDHLLCLFPFEIPYFTKHGISAYAVGHPAADINFPTRRQARKALGYAQNSVVIAVFPGSRRREVAELLPDMCTAIALLRSTHPDLKAVIPAAGTVRGIIEEYLTEDDHIEVVDEAQRYTLMKAADAGLICSGTLTLETALASLPGYVYYRTDALTAVVARLLFDRSKLVLANAVTDEVIYGEAVQKEFNGAVMAAHMRRYLQDEAKLDKAGPDKAELGKAGPGGMGQDMDRDMHQKLKTALTPDISKGKRGKNFQTNVVDRIDEILNVF